MLGKKQGESVCSRLSRKNWGSSLPRGLLFPGSLLRQQGPQEASGKIITPKNAAECEILLQIKCLSSLTVGCGVLQHSHSHQASSVFLLPPGVPPPFNVGHSGFSLHSAGRPPVRGVAPLETNVGILLQVCRGHVRSCSAETQTCNPLHVEILCKDPGACGRAGRKARWFLYPRKLGG